MTLSRICNTVRLLANLLWPQPDTTGITPAAITYYSSVLEENRK